MINTWWFNIIAYLILYVIFTQFYKVATKNSKNDGALTILLQFLSGVIVLIFMPLFKFQFPITINTYIFLIIACIFYAIADRVNTTARRWLQVSTYSILSCTNCYHRNCINKNIGGHRYEYNKYL